MATIESFFQELQFGRLEKPVKAHLQNVYTTMGLALFVCAAGGYIYLFTDLMIAGLFTTVAAFVTLIALVVMPPTNENRPTRLMLLMVFSFLTGLNTGPLLDLAISVDPSIIATAFLATSLIFVCFSLSALLANDRKYLALGGILFSSLTWLLLFGLLNIFLGSQLLFEMYLYLGLAIMCGFVLYDTQLIVEKCRRGDDDYIMHCLDLFMDFINIFRFLLILMTDKEAKKDKRRRN